MTQRPRAWEVVPLLPLASGARHRFAYREPVRPTTRPTADAFSIGSLVLVPFGRKTVRGIVWREHRKVLRRPALKHMTRLLSRQPLFSAEELRTLERLAALSLVPMPSLLKSAVLVRAPLGPTQFVSDRRRRTGARFSTRVRCAPIDAVLPKKSGGQTLILCPELAIGRRVCAALERRGVPLSLFAQTLPLRERRRVTLRLAQGEETTVVATHAGVFLPFPDLSSILVIEAALPSHRQWDLHPRYDARIAALLLARTRGVPIAFQSTLPSLDLFELARDATTDVATFDIPPDTFRIVSRRPNDALLLPDTIQHIRQAYEGGRTSFVFHDIVGTERVFRCETCGFTLRCGACGGTLERRETLLACHACGAAWGRVPHFCPRCRSPHIGPRRLGTATIELELRRIIPGSTVLRADRQTLERTGPLETSAMPRPSIVVGSERAFAALPPGSVDTVAVVNADRILESATVDAAERFLAVLVRLAALRSRTDEPVLVQTTYPQQSVVRALASGSLNEWLEGEREDRKVLGYPPFAALLRLETPREMPGDPEGYLLQVVRKLQLHEHPQHRIRVGARMTGSPTRPHGDLLVRGQLRAIRAIEQRVPRGWKTDPHIPLSLIASSSNTESGISTS